MESIPSSFSIAVLSDNGVEGRCTLMLSSRRKGDDYGTMTYGYDFRSVFHLGTTFTRSYCLLIDFSNGKVALAKRVSSGTGDV